MAHEEMPLLPRLVTESPLVPDVSGVAITKLAFRLPMNAPCLNLPDLNNCHSFAERRT